MKETYKKGGTTYEIEYRESDNRWGVSFSDGTYRAYESLAKAKAACDRREDPKVKNVKVPVLVKAQYERDLVDAYVTSGFKSYGTLTYRVTAGGKRDTLKPSAIYAVGGKNKEIHAEFVRLRGEAEKLEAQARKLIDKLELADLKDVPILED